MNLIRWIFLALPLNVAFAADQPYIAVGNAKTRRTILAIPTIPSAAPLAAVAKDVQKILQDDLAFIDLFQILDAKAYPATSASIAPGTFEMKPWTALGTEYLIRAKAEPHEKGVAVEAYLYQTSKPEPLLSKRYVAALGDSRTLAHSFANDVVNAITGLPGIFLTKIAMVCDRQAKKELYVMDFDGKNVRQITKHKSTVVSPTWTNDGTRIAYSVVTKNKKNVKNWNLYEFDFASSSIRLLSDRKGRNMGAAYHPDGKRIALTMNFLDETNSDIFIFNPETKTVTRLTTTASQDVDPFWSPDGKSLAFVSDRNGPSMIYRMNADGSDVRRLTFAGRNNATPAWSPRNNKIAFASWLTDNVADIFLMNPDGTTMERLTKSQGSNEDPHFSPDGNLIAFSSTRAGGKNVYIMNVDGTFQKRITYGLGNCTSPKWSNPPTK